MILKALGNMGIAGDSSAVLVRCASQTDNSMEIRLAAIDAFRRVPCSLPVSCKH